MKRVLILFILPYILYGETTFSGKGEITAYGNIPQEEYESPVNPRNVYNLRDSGVIPRLIMGIDSYDERSNFEAKFTLSSYPIGEYILYGTNEEDLPIVTEYLSQTGESINTFELQRLFIDIEPLEKVTLSLGRKPYLMGFGYGWNPTDLVNLLKSPEDPNKELKGIDSLSFSYEMSIAIIRGILDFDGTLESGIDYSDMALAGDIALYFDGLDILITGYYNFSENRTDRVNGMGLGFTMDIFGAALYGEGVILDGSRGKFPTGFESSYKEETLFSILGGIEHTFPTDTTLIGEYFYNGEGFNSDERDQYKEYLEGTGGILPLHKSSYYSRHYILLNISQPLWDLNTTLNGTTIYTPDSHSILLIPEAIYDLSGSSQISLSYSGIFTLDSDEFNEEELSPVKNSIALKFTTAF